MSQLIQSPMKKITLEKVVLNMGLGKSGDIIQVAKKALDHISGKKSCARDAKETQREWGVRQGEHIDIPGVKYDPQVGILGLGISVTLTRPGYGIRKRSKHKASVGKSHTIKNQEAKDYLAKEFGVTIV